MAEKVTSPKKKVSRKKPTSDVSEPPPSPLDVTFIVPYFHPIKGGTEKNALETALQTHKLGHTVRVFTSDRKGKLKLDRQTEDYQGVTIHRLGRWFFKQYYLTFLPSLLWKVLRLKTDIIHTHIPGVLWVDFVLILKKLVHRQTIFINTPHDPFMSRNNYDFSERVFRTIFLGWIKLYYNWLYDYVIAVSPNQPLWITKEYKVPPEKIIYVSNGVEADIFERVEIDPQTKKLYDIEDQVVFSMIGRYHEYKGYQTVLEALNNIRNKKQLNIKFIGMGEDTGMLPRLQNYIIDNKLEKYATLIEKPSDSVRDQILQLSQVFILASRVEAFGISIVEAMAKGNAIITTRTEGGVFLITPNNGFLYDFGDVDALTEYIVELASNADLRAQMGEYNKEYAHRFLWEKSFEPYVQLLQNIAKNKDKSKKQTS